MRVLHTLWISLVLSTTLILSGCGSLRDGGSATDVSDASSTEDPSDPTDATDTTEVTDPSDLSDESDPTTNSECDLDNDGDLSLECGGTDCEDENPLVSGQRLEICDFIDNNCDNRRRINEGLDCTVYVHTSTELFKLDPFTTEPPLYVGEVPGIVDFDTSSDVPFSVSRPRHSTLMRTPLRSGRASVDFRPMASPMALRSIKLAWPISVQALTFIESIWRPASKRLSETLVQQFARVETLLSTKTTVSS